MSVTVYEGDSLAVLRTLESESVQMCMTSPPYAFLRSYLPDGHPDKAKEIGSEPTSEEYVASLVEVFRDVRRVLRRDGICVLNLGDSMSGSGKGPTGHNGIGDQTRRQGFHDNQPYRGIPPKNLLMIPFRVAMALQADGWVLRSVMPWLKRNSMPESVTDRPATAVEYLFLLAKSPRYFWDAEAIRQGYTGHAQGAKGVADDQKWLEWYGDDGQRIRHGKGATGLRTHETHAGRSYRNSDPFFATWQGLMLDEAGDPLALVVNPQPSKLRHFASYPPSLVEPFILAGTSEKGACPACGAGWVRATSTRYENPGNRTNNGQKYQPGTPEHAWSPAFKQRLEKRVETVGWAPSCPCPPAEPVPQTVLDPFLGSGTTALVADRLGRSAIGVELSPTYCDLARKRLDSDAPLWSEPVEVVPAEQQAGLWESAG